jgi:hypothetical protein
MATASGTVSATQVYQAVKAQGGSTEQALVAAALVSGIESNGQLNDKNPTSTASGLFQFLDTTWASNGGTAYAPTAGQANLEQQVAVFLKASSGNNFYPWAPDLGGSYNGAPITTPATGSKVANIIAQDASAWESGAATPSGAASTTSAPATSNSSPIPGIPASLPAPPGLSSNPLDIASDIGQSFTWFGEFLGFSLFILMTFLLGAVLLLLGLALLLSIFLGPAVGPITAAVGKKSPSGLLLGAAGTFGSKKPAPAPTPTAVTPAPRGRPESSFPTRRAGESGEDYRSRLK